MFYQIIFLLLALVSLLCLVMAVRVKRRNIGLLIAIILVIACDIICFFLLGSKSIMDAKRYLVAYYVCHAWLYLGVLWAISAMGSHRHHRLYSIPAFVICSYQTVLMVSNLFGQRLLSFSRHILLGRTWWIAEDVKSRSFLFSFRAYRLLLIVNSFVILSVLLVYCIHTAKLFRTKFIVLIVAQIFFMLLENDAYFRERPVWILGMVINLLCILGVYLISYYSTWRLRDWSLMSFANEMSDGFILYDEHHDLIHMNDRVKETLPKDLLERFQDKEKLDEWLSDTMMVEQIEVLRFVPEEGERIYFKAKKTELSDRSYIYGTIYILHDTTETISQIRAMERANDELERAAKMKSDFLANMSHEIRTPMNAVIGMAEIAMREKLPPQVMDYLGQIQNSGRNLLNIINDILDFSKIEAGKMEIIPDRYEPLSEINDIANILVTRIGEKHLDLFVTADTNIPHALEGDAMRIRQVLINLANNAIKFTQEGVVVIQIFCKPTAEDEVELTYHVIDTGMGIKKEDLGKLFQSFQQVDSKRNRSVEGTGLGLAISQRLCEAMGGSIGVTSEYGRGSDFYFTIPQKVLEPECDLVVEQAQTTHAFCYDEVSESSNMFAEDVRRLGVDARVIQSVNEYLPTGERDYLFFREDDYGDEIHNLLQHYRSCNGVILVNFDSSFEPDLPNLRIMRKPTTILSMVMILNDKEIADIRAKEEGAFRIDFIAPEARILVVDDNAVNITIAEGLLQPLQAQIDSVLSGKEAIELVEQNPYDLILMDHMMPGMDGVETTHVIRRMIPSAADTPILALTANAMEGAKEMFIKEGMNDFVAKPIDIKDLAKKLKQWLPEAKLKSAEYINDEGELEEIFTDYAGLDSEAALATIGSPKVYQQIVGEYYRVGSAEHESIRTAYEKEDWISYIIKVHALKSSSRQIGAPALGELAAELEQAGKDKDFETIHANTEELLRQYRELLEQLSQYFRKEEIDEDSLPAILPEELRQILTVLSGFCDELDMDGMEAVKEQLMQHSYPEELRAPMHSLYEAIDNMDIDGCAELIEQIREAI